MVSFAETWKQASGSQCFTVRRRGDNALQLEERNKYLRQKKRISTIWSKARFFTGADKFHENYKKGTFFIHKEINRPEHTFSKKIHIFTIN